MIARYLHLANAVRHRYRAAHLKTNLPARALIARDGVQIGNLDEIGIENGRLRVTGWIIGAAKITLSLAGLKAKTVPDLDRQDVATVKGCNPSVGFDLSLPVTTDLLLGEDPAGLSFQMEAANASAPHPVSLQFRHLARSLRRLDLRFMARLPSTVGPAMTWITTRDATSKREIFDRLGLDRAPEATNKTLDGAVFAPNSSAPLPPPASRITIVLPIYNAFDLLPEVIERVLTYTDLPYHLIAINDASPDGRVWPWLQERVARHDQTASAQITLRENETNLGFIGTVNRGLAMATRADARCPDGVSEGPIVLLNSDAFVPEGWAARLVRPLLSNPKNATTTPMSNDAEIFSVPAICQRSDLPAGAADVLDALATQFKAGAAEVEVPTGVGFCMAMSRDWLAKIGTLDAIFGRGYGEEVDWCQRVRDAGGRHLAVRNLFVEHRGGSSFGSANKLALITHNNAIISRRYPEYDRQVQRFIQSDPLLTERLALGIAWADALARAKGAEVPVYLGHSMGGGAEIYLKDRIARDVAKLGCAIVIRVGGTLRWQLEVHSDTGLTQGGTEDSALVARLLGGAQQRHLIYSCGVGDPAPLDLPALLTSLRREDEKLTILVHDFFMISPSYTLTGSNGAFHATPDPGTTDPAHELPDATSAVGRVPLRVWQEAWGKLMQAADTVTVFSRDSAAHIAAAYPDAAGKLKVVPHKLPYRPRAVVPAAARPDDPAIRLGVLGGINRAKGALVVQELGRRIAERALDAQLTVIGDVDPTVPLPSTVTVHGRYSVDTVSDLAEHYRLTHWLIPSVWPETFSFTTHEALATGLPVVTFDLGAQALAAKRAANGHVVPYPKADAAADNLAEQLVDNIVEFLIADGVTKGARTS